jgi:L-amino acid N-acyltransferase YncA
VFFAAARQAGVTGLQVSVRADNAGGCDFFRRLGFIEVGRRAMVLPIGGRWITTAALTYAKKL